MVLRLAALALAAVVVTPGPSAAERLFQFAAPSDLLDISGIFTEAVSPAGEAQMLFKTEGKILKCCCNSKDCQLANLLAGKTCKGKKDEGCGCMVGSAYQIHTKQSSAACLVSASHAAEVILGSGRLINEVLDTVYEAERLHVSGKWHATYGECSSSCGEGARTRTTLTCPGGSCGPGDGDDKNRLPTSIPCTDFSGCKYSCQFPEVGSCGWGRASCVDSKGAPMTGCDTRALREKGFPSKEEFTLNECLRKCPAGPQALTSICAITTNHLDEQYGSVANLIDNTCKSSSTNQGNPMPQMVILMTQELNHKAKLPGGKNDFAKYIDARSLAGYDLVARCNAPLSAQIAIFLKSTMKEHVWQGDIYCSEEKLRSTCDYTNCKGSAVLSVITTIGRLVVASWHGARAGQLSEERVVQFEQTTKDILELKPFLGRRFVIFGGDTNVRSDFGTVSDENPPPWDPAAVHTGAQIFAFTRDIFGLPGKTVDQHLSGDAGLDPEVMAMLKESPLVQASDWNKLCPTYRKSMDVTDKKRKNNPQNLQCRSPADQMGTGSDAVELITTESMYGEKNRAPSWTERIFLSQDLSSFCGKALKDIRNPQNDHDPMYVICNNIPVPA